MKAVERLLYKLTLLGVVIALTLAGLSVAGLTNPAAAGKWFSTAGLAATIAGVLQLEISGLFDKIMSHYRDSEYGPPSQKTREIIDNPDRPVRTRIRNELFFEHRTGLILIIGGTGLQVAGNWV